MTRFILPLIGVGIIVWGFMLGFSGVGATYVALVIFSWFYKFSCAIGSIPMMFKRQFVKYQFGKSEQGIDLYQDYAIYANGHQTSGPL